MLSVHLKISPKVNRLIEQLPQDIMLKALPKAMLKVVPVVKRAIRRELPSGKKSRKKQSAKSRARFPYIMRDQIGSKTVKDENGMLKIIGVTDKARHVRFDHGEKAKGKGREHKLWFVEGKHEYWHKDGKRSTSPAFRKQARDVPQIVLSKVGGTVSKIVTDAIVKQVDETLK